MKRVRRLTRSATSQATPAPMRIEGTGLVRTDSTTVVPASFRLRATDVAPVGTANVKISLSTDGGLTYPTVLAESTPNDGSQAVTLPAVNTTTARIKVEAVGNVFFDVSNADFTIRPAAAVSQAASARAR